MAERVAVPLTGGCQGPRPGQDRVHRHAEHTDQCMPSTSPLPGVGHTSEVVEQAEALVGLQARDGFRRPAMAAMGDDPGQAPSPVLVGLTYHKLTRCWCHAWDGCRVLLERPAVTSLRR
jgi:hypothetical protein